MRLLAAITLLSCAVWAQDSNPPLQGKNCNRATSSTTITCAFTNPLQTESLLVAITRWDDGTPNTTATISSNAGSGCPNPWPTLTAKVRTGAGHQGMYSAYCLVRAPGAHTVQAVTGVANPFADIIIVEYGGVNPDQPLDKAVGAATTNTGAGSTPCAPSATATLDQPGNLIIAFCGTWDFTNVWANSGSFIYRSTISTNALGYFDYTTPLAFPVTFSYAITSDKWTSLVAAFNMIDPRVAAQRSEMRLMRVNKAVAAAGRHRVIISQRFKP